MKKWISKKSNAILLALFCMFLWGSAFPVLKVSYREMGIVGSDYLSKIWFAGLRFLLAGLIVLVIGYLVQPKKMVFPRSRWKFFLLLALIQTALQYFFFYIGVGNTTGMKSAILQSASTFLVVLFSHFAFEDDRMNKNKVIALILGFGGILLANLGKEFDLNFKWDGEGFLLISSTLNAIGMVFVKKRGEDLSPFVMTAAQMILGSLMLLGAAAMMGFPELHWTPLSILLLLYSGVLSALAFSLWYFLLQEYKAGEISMFRLFIPIFGALLSAIFLNEQVTLALLAGLFFVILGTYFVYRKKDA